MVCNVHSSSWETHRATERHLPYGNTQCCMPPDTDGCPTLTSAKQDGTQFTYHGGMKGWKG